MSKVSNEIVEKYEDYLRQHFKEALPELKTILKETGAVIAGGSVASYVCNKFWLISDLDIYVNMKNSVKIRDFLLKFAGIAQTQGRSNLYCNSFLSKNNIIKVNRFYINTRHTFHYDLMYIHNDTKVLDVVNNFDLTCCQSWYDGENIYTSHPDLINQSKALLNREYLMSFINDNYFIKNRIKKYSQRGIEISIPSININTDIFKIVKPEINIEKSLKRFVFLVCFNIQSGYRTHILNGLITDYISDFKLNINNKVYFGFDKDIFNDDGYDYKEFNTIEDYEKIGQKKNFMTVITYINEKLDIVLKHTNKNILHDFRKCFKSLYKNLITEIPITNNYPELKETCFDDIELQEFNAGEYLSINKNNILIKIGENLKGYNREKLLDHFKQKTKILDEYTITRTYLNQNIFKDDVPKFKLKNIKIYIIKDNGVRINDIIIYNVEPISIEKYLKL